MLSKLNKRHKETLKYILKRRRINNFSDLTDLEIINSKWTKI